MDIDKLSSLCSRVFFAAALMLFVLAVLEWVLARFNVALATGYDAGRLVEFAAMFLLPVVIALLRQIREELRKQKPA